MARTTKKQVKKLRKGAEELWQDQQDILNRANKVLQEAAGHARDYASDLGPTARKTYDRRVKPAAAASGKAGRFVGGAARDVTVGTVVPAFTSAAGAAIAIAEEAADRLGAPKTDLGKKAGKAAKQLGKTTRSGQRQAVKGRAKLKVAGKAAKAAARAKGVKLPKQKSGIGAGGVIGIVIGVIAVSGIAYAVWRTVSSGGRKAGLWSPAGPSTPTNTISAGRCGA